ncbi:DUF2314 domain-containing protein [Buttiauxella sp. 3AFRM03]|uniref:YegJ family protein n=1 Tax=Buttiauxella sp. 3AFRM03 TaxID=2479367 RepID=UPI000EF7F9A0|nr:DUF2314 domain-containing protein [Buttiauxella sp. 3AFRM03]AYN27014.1 DUF2314 domain-containing protein [Buttiauxella sp. 3AFRM03]
MKIFLLFLLAVVGTTAVAQQRDDNEIVLVESDDPEMVAAIRTAREGLDTFLKLASAPAANTSEYRLKVMVRDGEDTEHFWVMPFQQTATGFSGTLANDPEVITNVEGGQEIQFSRDDISDWGYERGGRQVGSYTVCALFKNMSAEQVDYYRKYGFDC